MSDSLRHNCFVFLGWLLASILLFLGWYETNSKNDKILELLHDNFHIKVEALSSRVESLENDVHSRTNRRWMLEDQVRWAEHLEKANPSMKIPQIGVSSDRSVPISRPKKEGGGGPSR